MTSYKLKCDLRKPPLTCLKYCTVFLLQPGIHFWVSVWSAVGELKEFPAIDKGSGKILNCESLRTWSISWLNLSGKCLITILNYSLLGGLRKITLTAQESTFLSL